MPNDLPSRVWENPMAISPSSGTSVRYPLNRETFFPWLSMMRLLLPCMRNLRLCMNRRRPAHPKITSANYAPKPNTSEQDLFVTLLVHRSVEKVVWGYHQHNDPKSSESYLVMG